MSSFVMLINKLILHLSLISYLKVKLKYIGISRLLILHIKLLMINGYFVNVCKYFKDFTKSKQLMSRDLTITEYHHVGIIPTYTLRCWQISYNFANQVSEIQTSKFWRLLVSQRTFCKKTAFTNI